MSEKDDDFLDHGGEEFTADDDFEIPDDPNEDFLNEEESDFELTEDDVVDDSGSDDFLENESGDIDLDEFDQDETAEAAESNEHEEDLEYEDSEEDDQGDATLGMKAWIGIALVAILAAGGIFYYASSTLSGGQAEQQASQSLPQPPPAPTQPQQVPPPAPQANSQSAQAQSNQVRENAPVSVSPFPESNGSGTLPATQNESGLAMTPPPANNAPQMSGGNSGSGNITPPPAPGNSGGSGSADNQLARAFSLDEPEADGNNDLFGMTGNENTSGSPIAQPRARTQPDREPQYMQALQEQRQAFSALMNATQNNGKQLESVKSELKGYQKETRNDVAELDKRVDRLETLIKAGNNLNNQGEKGKPQAKADTEKKVAAATLQGAPKSPAEIKALQRTLKEFGYRPGFIDGILGGQTRWAIKRLQQEHDIKKTGWLDKETLAALKNPKQFSGTYDEKPAQSDGASKKLVADRSSSRTQTTSRALEDKWFIRGVTPTKAIIYRNDGMSFIAKVGTEIPGMGQVTQLDPEKLHVITPGGVITKR